MSATSNYLQCLKELQDNPNIRLGEYSEKNHYTFKKPTTKVFGQLQEELEKQQLTASNADLEYFNLWRIKVNWDSQVSLADTSLRGGFVFNSVPSPLPFASSCFKNRVNIRNDGYQAHQLQWFERLPVGVADSMRGCFLIGQRAGHALPPVAFTKANWSDDGWFARLDFDYQRYMELLFQNYGFKGWQYFYIDIVGEIPEVSSVLEDMRVAVKTLPLLFPDKDWSYHRQRYEETLARLTSEKKAADSNMSAIEAFARDFIAAEYRFTTMRFDPTVSDEDCQAQATALNDFYRTFQPRDYRRNGREFQDESSAVLSATKKARAVPRTLFKIRHYAYPLLDLIMLRHYTGTDLYICHLSRNISGGEEDVDRTLLYVVQTYDGWKIIDQVDFDEAFGKWRHADERVNVEQDGMFVKKENYIALTEKPVDYRATR